jgi:hypothetical protein
LTPVFGTACPLRGLSGLVRRYAYGYSEARLAHWVLLVLGDRLDVIESRFTAALRGGPDNPVSEMGLRAELRRDGLRSRWRRRPADLVHAPVDVHLFVLPRMAAAFAAAVVLGRFVARRSAR